MLGMMGIVVSRTDASLHQQFYKTAPVAIWMVLHMQVHKGHSRDDPEGIYDLGQQISLSFVTFH